MLMDREKNASGKGRESTENLTEQYKPLGLKAVLAAATQRRPATRDNERRDIPAILQDDER